ncbi:hypothetical protein SAMN04488134_11635 [Amphibacillus marinus]|uniref:DUF4352 domain-containing protein n=1 Tax=Amphibacillus marinus TaxID=872970 RepID=A0A1H8TGV7_9BACI|nr:hypothetical protein [Amphibacillus marinus]SEO90061.1 hypothetical protein SAMN04488134_11635 [Amphibacillus marinus]
MKRIILFLSVLSMLSACTQNDTDLDKSLLDEEVLGAIEAEVVSFNLESALIEADLVAEVTILNKLEEVKEEPIPYTVFNAKIANTYKGSSAVDNITIKQQGDSDWLVNNIDLFQEGEAYIFFLKETKASKSDYWILGEATGYFQVVDNNTIVKLVESIPELNDIEIAKKSNYKILNSKTTLDEQVLIKEEFITKITTMEGENK